jgi:osmotically-inducible protein OsmY
MTSMHVRTDHQIQTAVVKELDWSPGVDSEHIGVGVTDGAVTLSGEVSSLPQRNAAVKAAMRIHCVVALVDNIDVRSSDVGYHDADLARDANAALARHAQLNDAQVHATVHERIVTLTGTVNWHFEREAARKTIESISGVLDVVNELTVRAAATRTDAEASIRAALDRVARQAAGRIEVTVTGDEVTLRGSVHSWTERCEAEQAAWSARGITRVVNDLKQTP